MNARSLVIALGLAALGTGAWAASPYAGQESREIKALSPQEIGDLLAGKGMGYAKAAELNGYAGPAHVLELASELRLSAEQRARTEALFAAMSGRAQELGQALVEKERELDRLFATKGISAEQLGRSLQAIGALQARVRQAHLEAHLAQAAILTPEQNARYVELRGYGAVPPAGGHVHKH